MNALRLTHPVFFLAPLAIVAAATAEAFWLQRSRGRYDWRAYFASLGDLMLRIASGLLPLGLAAGALNLLWAHRIFDMPMRSWWTWLVLFVGQDFFYYWMHLADHRVRWLWATHSVHHTPNELNLAAAYRLGWTARLSVAPIFFAPLALIGFSPTLIGGALALNLLYQFWLHAEWLPSLGPLEWLLNTPQHHRVHHASNPEYIDCNYGGVLIVFDRMFGTHRQRLAGDALRYGLAVPVHSYNPVYIGVREWMAMARDVLRSRSWRKMLNAAFGPPR
jgi:sterol desaturase/sphingolipid hydroxylase (fatty acid hydroxylase superfamily)